MTALLDVRAALSTLLGDYIGTYTLTNGATTPAVAVRAIGEARKTGTEVAGMELIIERDPDTIQVQTQGQSPTLYEWTIWLVSWDESSLDAPAEAVVAAFANVEVEPIRVPEGSGPSNQIRISLQTGQSLILTGPPSGVTVTGASDEALIILGSASGFVGAVSIGTSSGTLTTTGSAAGVVIVTAATSGTLAITGTAAGVVRVTGSSAQTLAITGSATGSIVAAGTGQSSATLAIAGAAAGTVRVTGATSQTLAIAGTAAGTVQVTGSSSQTLAISGTAAGTIGAVAIGASSATFAIAGTAAGIVRVAGTSAQALALTGTATATVRVAGASIQTMAVTGTAAGTIRVAGSSSQTLAITGTATGTSGGASFPAPTMYLPLNVNTSDSSANAFTPTGTPTPTLTTTNPPPIHSAYHEFVFNGGDALRYADTDLLDPGTGNFTISAFLRPNIADGMGLYPVWCSKGAYQSSAGAMALFRRAFGGTRLGMGFSNPWNEFQADADSSAAETWVRVTIVRLGDTITLYTGTTATGTVNATGLDLTSTHVFVVGGALDDNNDNWVGGISDFVYIKGTALTTDQIASLQTASYASLL